MRLWSFHPYYLDSKGLIALWREGLLARAVLRRRTRGYRNHPQVGRFQACAQPTAAIDRYLRSVYEESCRRGYHFNGRKLGRRSSCPVLWVTKGQIRYEWKHLLGKLKERDRSRYRILKAIATPRPHPFFRIKAGGIAPWERTAGRSARRRSRAIVRN
jgi:hypothetical protein